MKTTLQIVHLYEYSFLSADRWIQVKENYSMDKISRSLCVFNESFIQTSKYT